LKGSALCGPCKNQRLREINKPTSVSGKAVVGAVLALCFAPLATCLMPFGANGTTLVFFALALLGQAAAMLLGALALRDTEHNPRLSGKSLAITTLLSGAMASLLTVYLMLVGLR
jgi:hypothetical protein